MMEFPDEGCKDVAIPGQSNSESSCGEDKELCVTCISREISLSCLCWLLVLQSLELSPLQKTPHITLKTIAVIMYYDYILEIEMLIFCGGNYHSKCTFYITLKFLR